MGCASSQQDAELRAFQLAQLQQQKDLKASMIPTTHAGVTEVRWKSVNGVRSVMTQAEVDEMYAKVDAALAKAGIEPGGDMKAQQLALREKIKAETEAKVAKMKAESEARVAAIREKNAQAGTRNAAAAAAATKDPVTKLSMLQMAEMSGLPAQWAKDGNPPEGLTAAYAELALKHQQQHQDLAKGKSMEEVLNPLGHIDDLE